jgi:hypothetical protein
VQGEHGKNLLRRRGELVERSFAHCYETGGMRRTHLRGHENILKRQLIHVGAFNRPALPKFRSLHHGLLEPSGAVMWLQREHRNDPPRLPIMASKVVPSILQCSTGIG